ncbi:MAG TPA: cellulase family glycosylhydrolase [Polyangiaceae bacterium]|nr:cellulase family glycosylhydrolase [Polyangiaceae bacterium]
MTLLLRTAVPARVASLVSTTSLAFLCLLAPGCLRLKSAAVPPEPKYMDTTDRYERMEVPESRQPSAAFVLDGKPLCFQGTNNYYLIYKSRRMVDDVFKQAAAMNLKVMRMWAYLDRGSLDGSVPSIDGDGTKDGVYFRYWDPVTQQPVVNLGENGLQRLDYVLTKAREHGVRLILVLTNNWREFGGMDQYVTWYKAQYHDEFYTHPGIRKAYKDYASLLINRKNTLDGTLYKEDPAIFAWELANEPRCRNGDKLDRMSGWDKTTMVRWADEMSSAIRAEDPNHLIAVGDEGFLSGGGAGWLYEATDGVDHEALSSLPNIDFATFHLYPDNWGLGYKQGYHWIEEHIRVARRIGKPTMLEEYGTLVKRDPKSFAITRGWQRRETAYVNWNELMLRGGGNASMFWMLAGIDDHHGTYPDYDGYQVYRGLPTGKLLHGIAQQYETSAAACKYSVDVSDMPPSPFVKVKRLPVAAKPQATSGVLGEKG